MDTTGIIIGFRYIGVILMEKKMEATGIIIGYIVHRLYGWLSKLWSLFWVA